MGCGVAVFGRMPIFRLHCRNLEALVVDDPIIMFYFSVNGLFSNQGNFFVQVFVHPKKWAVCAHGQVAYAADAEPISGGSRASAECKRS